MWVEPMSPPSNNYDRYRSYSITAHFLTQLHAARACLWDIEHTEHTGPHKRHTRKEVLQWLVAGVLGYRVPPIPSSTSHTATLRTQYGYCDRKGVSNQVTEVAMATV